MFKSYDFEECRIDKASSSLDNILKYNDSAIRTLSRANVIEIGISYLDYVSSRDVSYCGIIVDFGSSKNNIQIEMQVMVLIENLDNDVLGRK